MGSGTGERGDFETLYETMQHFVLSFGWPAAAAGEDVDPGDVRVAGAVAAVAVRVPSAAAAPGAGVSESEDPSSSTSFG
jgi:hypothetical protein